MKKLLSLAILLLPFIAAAQDIYHIKFTSQEVHYSVAVIVYDDDTGKMRVRYDNGIGEKLYEMTVKLRDTSQGFVIDGSSPREVWTGSTTGYSADHFYVTVDDSGEITCRNADDNDSDSQCCIMEVLGDYNQNVFLKEFNWTFD